MLLNPYPLTHNLAFALDQVIYASLENIEIVEENHEASEVATLIKQKLKEVIINAVRVVTLNVNYHVTLILGVLLFNYERAKVKDD